MIMPEEFQDFLKYFEKTYVFGRMQNLFHLLGLFTNASLLAIHERIISSRVGTIGSPVS